MSDGGSSFGAVDARVGGSRERLTMPNRRQMPSRFHPSPGVVGLAGECASEEIESGGKERRTTAT